MNSIRHLLTFILLSLLPALSFNANSDEEAPFILVASTTSTESSGLYDYLLPIYEQYTGVDVRVVAVGTGAALDIGRRCDADIVLVHAPSAEEEFIKQGYGVKRHPLMYNDFVLVGPENDPADIEKLDDAAKALAKIAEKQATFASRGDDSGTHKKELALWKAAGVDPVADSGSWYQETGSGMGTTLNTAQAKQAYTLSDRGTWISFQNKGKLKILVEGDERLFNPYGVILVNPVSCPNVKQQLAQDFIDWLISRPGQAAIGAYKLQGKQLFHPNANLTLAQ